MTTFLRLHSSVHNKFPLFDWSGDQFRAINPSLRNQPKIKDTTFTMDEMMSLKLFTDTTKLREILNRSHLTDVSLKTQFEAKAAKSDKKLMTDEDLKRATLESRKVHYKAHYHWAMALYRTHLYHAKPILESHGIFHGYEAEEELRDNVDFTSVSGGQTMFSGPFSATNSLFVAGTFNQNRGFAMRFDAAGDSPFERMLGVETSAISAFILEGELLLCDQHFSTSRMSVFGEDVDFQSHHLLHCLQMHPSQIGEATELN